MINSDEMEKSISILFDELDKIWNLSKDSRFKGEHPKCVEIQEEIITILDEKSDDDIMDILNSIDNTRLEQIEYIIEELVSNHKCIDVFLTE